MTLWAVRGSLRKAFGRGCDAVGCEINVRCGERELHAGLSTVAGEAILGVMLRGEFTTLGFEGRYREEDECAGFSLWQHQHSFGRESGWRADPVGSRNRIEIRPVSWCAILCSSNFPDLVLCLQRSFLFFSKCHAVVVYNYFVEFYHTKNIHHEAMISFIDI